MKILLSGMHRSGINVVGRWLLRQSSLKSKPLESIFGDWVEGYVQESYDSYGFISQINHPAHLGHYDLFNFTHKVMTIEREHFNYVQKFPIPRSYIPLIILRDFKNWSASCYKMSGQLPDILDVQKYESLLKSTSIRDSIEFDRSFLYINYNDWCTDSEYRKDLCQWLGLRYTNCGFRDVPSNGGGSSFDKASFDGKGNEMNTLKRWKYYENDNRFQEYLDYNSDIVKKSEKYFGV